MSFLFHSPLHVWFPVTHTFDDRPNGASGSSCPEKSTDMLLRCRDPAVFAGGSAASSSLCAPAGAALCGAHAGSAARGLCFAPKTRCGGMISPSVRVSFAMRRRRVSVAEGNTGVVGVIAGVPVGVGEPGVTGVRGVRGVGGTRRRLPDRSGECAPATLIARGAGARCSTSGCGSSFVGRDFERPGLSGFGVLGSAAVSDVERAGGCATPGLGWLLLSEGRVGYAETEACRLLGL